MHKEILINIRAQCEVATPLPKQAKRLVLGFHGYAENSVVQLDRLCQLGLDTSTTVLCAPEAFNRFYNKKGNVVASWMTKSFRLEAIADCINYINKVIENLFDDYGYEVPLSLFGFSQGGALAYRYSLHGRFKSDSLAVVGSDIPPELLGELDKLPALLVCHGQEDKIVSPSVFEESIKILEDKKVVFEKLLYEGGHTPSKECLLKIGSFINKTH